MHINKGKTTRRRRLCNLVFRKAHRKQDFHFATKEKKPKLVQFATMSQCDASMQTVIVTFYAVLRSASTKEYSEHKQQRPHIALIVRCALRKVCTNNNAPLEVRTDVNLFATHQITKLEAFLAFKANCNIKRTSVRPLRTAQ